MQPARRSKYLKLFNEGNSWFYTLGVGVGVTRILNNNMSLYLNIDFQHTSKVRLALSISLGLFDISQDKFVPSVKYIKRNTQRDA